MFLFCSTPISESSTTVASRVVGEFEAFLILLEMANPQIPPQTPAAVPAFIPATSPKGPLNLKSKIQLKLCKP